MKLTSTLPLVGTPSSDSWAQVFEFNNTQTETQSVSVISLTQNDPQTNVSILGKSALEDLKSDLANLDRAGILNNLKAIVEKNLENLVTLAQTELAVGIFVDQYAYFCVWGSARVCVFRDGRLLPILIGKEGGLGSCSGKTKIGDVFVLGTQEFFALTDNEELARLLAGQDMSAVSDSLASRIHQGNLPKLAAEIVRVGQDEVPAAQEIQKTERKITIPNVNLPKVNLPEFPNPGRFLLNILAQRLPGQDTQVSEKDRPRRTAVIVGTILLFVLIASVFLGIAQRQGKNNQDKIQGQIDKAQTLYTDAKTQIDINPGQARQYFAEAQTIVLELEKEFKDNEQVKSLKTQIDADAGIILGKITENPQTFLDLSLVRSDVLGKEIFLANERVIVLDEKGKRLISVNLQGRDTVVVGGEENLSQVKSASLYNSRYLVLTDSGIKRVARDGTTDTLLENDSEWGDIVKIAIFSGNLYLLTSQGQVWRYTDTGITFANKALWSRESAGSSKDLAIDGFVWILGSGIKRFSRGIPENFQIKNLETPINSAKAIYTDEELDSVYVLDGGRIVEIDKTSGEFRKEYLNEAISGALDLTISKEAQKIFLLTQTKVLELPLR